MREDFRPILGYEGHYEINSEGVVVSTRFNKRKVLKTFTNNKGYICISLKRDKKQKNHLIHKLVWISFYGNIPKGLQVRHGEGNHKTNNCLEYLSLGTASDNNGRDKIRDGTIGKGVKNSQSKLCEVQVKYIKDRLADGMLCKSLAPLFGVTRRHLSDIQNDKRWSHVT